ncbi:MAG: 30S ribosome-binding factor RbfA [Candidatus Omnitrophica bacterium]|nr:30S ribosome-binding factor RbfA [Candidatus Omnitrophota bacterium]MDD5237789.1 30S ribosome-binding factor RbfA [Candidatus Omnitrophota bacterium]
MMSRKDKVTEAIRKEVSIIVHDELKDPRLGFVTITRVEMSKDLRFAKIFFSVLGKDEDYKKTRDALDSALGFIRRLVAQRIRLRFAPEIIFREDRSSEYSVKIQQVLEEIKELDEPQSKGRPKKKGRVS